MYVKSQKRNLNGNVYIETNGCAILTTEKLSR
jgi:hypothetical protein